MNNNNPSLLSSALEGKKQYTVYQCKRMSVPIVVVIMMVLEKAQEV